MGEKSAEVDAYIAKAAPFAQPILERIRRAFHKADPAIRKAVKLNESGARVERAPRAAAPPPEVPEDLLAALRKDKKALAAFEQFPPSHKD